MSLPRLPMNAVRLLLAAALPLSLAACEAGFDPKAVLGQIRDAPPAQRKSIILQKIAMACPAPMTNAERARFATLVLRLADDADVVDAVDRLDRFDAETLICRRGAPVKKPAKRKASAS